MVIRPIYRYGQLDTGSVCKLYRQKDVYLPSSDDLTKPSQIMRYIDLLLGNPNIFLVGTDPRKEVFMFAPSHNATTFQVHVAVREDARGRDMVERMARSTKYVFENSTCRAVIAFFDENNKGAHWVARRIGMQKIGVTRGTTLKKGKDVNEMIYQATFEDFNARWGEKLGRV